MNSNNADFYVSMIATQSNKSKKKIQVEKISKRQIKNVSSNNTNPNFNKDNPFEINLVVMNIEISS